MYSITTMGVQRLAKTRVERHKKPTSTEQSLPDSILQHDSIACVRSDVFRAWTIEKPFEAASEAANSTDTVQCDVRAVSKVLTVQQNTGQASQTKCICS